MSATRVGVGGGCHKLVPRFRGETSQFWFDREGHVENEHIWIREDCYRQGKNVNTFLIRTSNLGFIQRTKYGGLNSIRIKQQGSWNDNTAGKAIALHEVNLGLIPGLPYGTLSSSGVTSEHIIRSKP